MEVHLYGRVWLTVLQSVLAIGRKPCTFYNSGTLIATYCESDCCGSTCCGQTEGDSSTASIVLGVVTAISFMIIIVVIVVCCFKHLCPCQSRKKEKHNGALISDNVVSILEETDEKDVHKPPDSVRYVSRDETFGVHP